jgi:hypothetical protein
MSRLERTSGIRIRLGLMATTAVLLVLLLGPATAQATHGFSLSTTQAAPGDEVEFSISNTQPGESYIVTVDNEEVASGVDDAGNGVVKTFTMPNLGDSSKSVAAELTVAPTDGTAYHFAPYTIKYSPAFTGPTQGTGATEPEPVRTVPVAPASPRAQQPARATPRPAGKKEPREKGKDKPRKEPRDRSPDPTTTGGQTPTTTFTPSATPSPSTTTTSVGSTKSLPGGNRGSTLPPGATGPDIPPAPEGSTNTAPALTPLSGLAKAGKTGFPMLLLVLALLLLAAALAAAAPRLWQRWQPVPFGPPESDDMRLGALQRASASGAELQKTIAARRATRSARRTG